jgi:beta-lactamase regulating signal transducer with metallopeptidase domain/protocatechuate 3,4-dioxygenase beta subunit/peroxiredoxin
MNTLATWVEMASSLSSVTRTALALLVKLTAVLSLAWIAHVCLANQNPRWRVAMWRATIVGVPAIMILSLFPPIVTWRLPLRAVSLRNVGVQGRDPQRSAEEIARAPALLEPALRTEAVGRIDKVSKGSRPDPASRRLAIAQVKSPTQGVVAPQTDHVARSVPIPTSARSVETGAGRLERRLVALVWGIWLTGALMSGFRLYVGCRRLGRILRGAQEAPAWVNQECRDLAPRMACGQEVSVRCSREISSPILTGLRSSVVLLPESLGLGNEAHRGDLLAVLYHELAHLRASDLHWNFAGQCTATLLWFHPLVWRVCAAHASACDAVCDAFAAGGLGDARLYGQSLARLALRALGPPPGHGLAMARTSDVRRRIEALNRIDLCSALPWSLAMLALLTGSALLLFVGGLGFAREGPVAHDPKPPPNTVVPVNQDKAKLWISFRAVAAETNAPLEGVEVSYQGHFDGANKNETIKTDKDGTVSIEWAPGTRIDYLSITARKPGFVPIHIRWSDDQKPLNLPPIKVLKFHPGITIGGVVKDEAGKPIAGASVSVLIPATESDMRSYYFHIGQIATDVQGRWKVDGAPIDLAGLSIRVEHPKYQRGFPSLSKTLDNETVMKKGLSITGQVIDGEGRPVRGATAVLGHDIWGTDPPTGTTNGDGRFVLENCQAGSSIVTVQADGFSPQIHDVQVDANSKPISIRLGPPAILKIRVVDADGRPIAGAHIAPDTWRGHRSIMHRANADAAGRYEWGSAPTDSVQYDILKDGYMARRHYPITASDQVQTVVLYPKLVISGQVTDAESGDPVAKFRVVRGSRFEAQEKINWSPGQSAEFSDGEYTLNFTEPSAGLFLRIEALGYEQVDSRAFLPHEGRQILDFALRRAEGPSGIVLQPDGQPAKGAEVVLASEGSTISLRAGRFDRDLEAPRALAGADGRFRFPAQKGAYTVIALSAAGIAKVSNEELSKSTRLTLAPWGKIEGETYVGRKPAVEQEVSFRPLPPEGENRWDFIVDFGYSVRSDEKGRFQFDRVLPGRGTLSRSLITQFPGGRTRHTPGWEQVLEIKPGETTQVKVGGNGRAVVGQVVLDGKPEFPVDWTQNDPVTIGRGPGIAGPNTWPLRFVGNIEKDGRFRIEDVPPGSYDLSIPVNGLAQAVNPGWGSAIGRATMPIVVPESPQAREDEAYDLGKVEAKLFETLRVGDQAPNFSISTLDGKQLGLSDYAGKLVLLDFWASWSPDSLTEMPGRKELRDAFADEPRFALIGLSCDYQTEAAKKAVNDHGLNWPQGVAGNIQVGLAKSYKVRVLPTSFLVGPDGKVLARNLRGAELKQAVRTALMNAK